MQIARAWGGALRAHQARTGQQGGAQAPLLPAAAPHCTRAPRSPNLCAAASEQHAPRLFTQTRLAPARPPPASTRLLQVLLDADGPGGVIGLDGPQRLQRVGAEPRLLIAMPLRLVAQAAGGRAGGAGAVDWGVGAPAGPRVFQLRRRGPSSWRCASKVPRSRSDARLRRQGGGVWRSAASYRRAQSPPPPPNCRCCLPAHLCAGQTPRPSAAGMRCPHV